MTGAYQADGDQSTTAGVPPVGGAAGDSDAADLVAQIRQLAGHDPAGVQQVVAEVLAALDRASGGALRDQLPAGLSIVGGQAESPVRLTGSEPAGDPVEPEFPADPH